MSMSDLREYKCPACGGAIEFDSKSQKMKCPYCDTEFELETLKELDAQMEREAGQQDDLSGWQTDAGGEWQEGETDGMNVYTCQSCGGEIIADENTGASNCPYCGNPVIMTEKFKGALRPDLVIPFKLDKKAAKEAYYRHIKGRTFLPKAFRRENHIDEIKFGVNGSMVQTTVCNGKVLMKDREVLVCDEAKVMADCRQAAKELADDING